MAKLHPRIIGTFITACLVATGCGGEPTAAELSLEARKSRVEAVAAAIDEMSQPPSTTNWATNELPVPSSPLTSVAGNVIYRAVENGTLYLIAVSAQEGTEVWRQEIDPLGQLRGTAPTPLVLEELAFVVSPQFIDSQERLTAFDALTGETVWSEAADFFAVPAFTCGVNVCTHNAQRRNEYDALTGTLSTSVQAPHVETIFATTSQLVFASGPRPDGNTDWVALHEADTGDLLWKANRADVEAAAGITVSPEFGWNAVVDEPEGIVAWYAGTDNADYSGVWTGFDIKTGEVRWTYVDQQDCIFDDYAPAEILVCSTNASNQLISRLDLARGEPAWSAVIGSSDEYAWTGAVGDYVFAESASGLTIFDVASGAARERSEVQLCGFRQPWQSIDVGWWDEALSYRAASLPALCDENLATVTAKDANEIDPGLSRAAHLSVGNGWFVAVGVDGELSGVYPR